MKNNFVILLLVLNVFWFKDIEAQDYSCNSNNNTQSALDTYWHYRYRFINYFISIGMGNSESPQPNANGVTLTLNGNTINYIPGQSIPAYAINGGNSIGCNNVIWYSDCGRNLGYYIGTLATEYYLLSQYNQNNPTNLQSTNETVRELFYALHAAFRLDSLGIEAWTSVVDGNIMPELTPTWPGDGFMISDDALEYLYPWIGDNYLSLINLPSIPTPPSTSYYKGYGAFGSGEVGGLPNPAPNPPWLIKSASAYGLNSMNATSQDNYYGLLMGLSLAVALLPTGTNKITSFYDPSLNTNVYFANNYSDLQNMAKQLGTAILQYIFNCNYVLKYPDGSDLSNIGCGVGYCTPLREVNSSFFSASPPSDCPISECDFGAGWDKASDLCDLCIPNFVTLGDCPPPIMNIEMACELAAMSNIDGSGNSGNPYVNELIESLGNISSISCSPWCSSGDNYNQVGEDLLFQAINQVLYPSNNNFGNSYLNLCNMADIINSAPYDGPFNHEPLFQAEPYDFASCGWAAPNRFIWGTGTAYGSNTIGGNWNGLDYMLFYNLYCIMSQWQNSYLSAITVPTGCTYPYEYPTSDESCSTNPPGTNTDQFTISSQYCTPINLYQLNVSSTGGLILQGGQNSFIDLNPTAGDIIISSGGYFDASCPLTCCEIPNNSYTVMPDPGVASGDDRTPVRHDSTTNYYITNEFSLKSNYDAIIAYPNPFQEQTTLEFAIKETTPVTISIYDMQANKIMDVFVNQTYNQGNYAQNFDGSNLASGTYLAVMTTKDDKKTIKIIKN